MSSAARSLRKHNLPSLEEEAPVRALPSASVSKDAACATFKTKMSSPLVAIFLLVVLSAGIAFSRDAGPADAKLAAGGAEQRTLQLDAWEYVDEELLTLYTGQGGVVRTTSIVGPGSENEVSAHKPGRHSEIAITVTTETDGGSPTGTITPEGDAGSSKADSTIRENGEPAEAGGDDERAAELERDAGGQAARAHRRTKARRKGARRMPAGGQEVAGSE